MQFAAAVAGAAAQAAVQPAAPTNQWTSKLGQCGEGAPLEHWLMAAFCTPCTAALAKSKVDQSNPFFNGLCFTPLGSYNAVRLSYNIMGDCASDLVNGGLCMWCGTRQAYSESLQLGSLPGSWGGTSGSWTTTLFQCGLTEFCFAAVCPCLVTNLIREQLNPTSEKWFNVLCIFPFAMYGQTRHTVGIPSDFPHPVCEDLAVGTIFYPCALNRALREAVAFRAKQRAGSAVSKVADGVSSAIGSLRAKVGIR